MKNYVYVLNSDIDKIAEDARASLSDYCINECKAKCCKFGKLVLFNNVEINAVCSTKRIYFEKKGLLVKQESGNYHFDLENGGCSKLTKDNKCSIHSKPEKPKICSDYPLFIPKKKFIIAAQNCQGVENGLLDEYIEQLEKLGLKKI